MTNEEMTNEEAVKILKGAIKKPNTKDGYLGQAIDMAIKALEQQPCEDCISRTEALRHRRLIHDDDGIGYSVVRVDEIIALPSVTPKTGWIPVSERLPEKQITIGKYVFSEYVLGTEGYTIRRAYYNYTTKEWFDGNEEMEWTEITHWMPLPEETPKVESEDKE